ncbi:hypothetical protein [Aliarcobacter butzleri]|uniref:Lipopolysaccharide biosynthesis protein n=1 Tax=Aliarcobacter butzleri TaxID=28197 RepID=A0AAW7Q4Z4_9BACT|nr:hypothetical protein [Aliarcobacter butzleri]MDN5114345.1 hypothetical protein [Aliarcobacter butzleri]
MQDLKGKRVLFIGIGFYDYDEHIVTKMQDLGVEVNYYKEYPKLTKLQYLQKKLLPKSEKKLIEYYYNNIFENIKSKIYDYVLVIKGDRVPEWFISKLKDKYTESQFILYQWDSIKRLQNFNNIKKYFNNILTFDRLDSIQYGYKFRPLFYKDIYLNNEESSKDYDVFFSGYLHSDRYDVLKKLINNYTKLKIKHHLYIRKIEFIKEQIKRFTKIGKLYDNSLVNFVSINDFENMEWMRKSKAVLDLHHPQQSGLTIRTIEALAMGNKIITTNEDIKNYEFYNSTQICVIDRNTIEIPFDFFQTYNYFTSKEKEKYSLEQWVIDVFKL